VVRAHPTVPQDQQFSLNSSDSVIRLLKNFNECAGASGVKNKSRAIRSGSAFEEAALDAVVDSDVPKEQCGL
jgi:hypothetical protein